MVTDSRLGTATVELCEADAYARAANENLGQRVQRLLAAADALDRALAERGGAT